MTSEIHTLVYCLTDPANSLVCSVKDQLSWLERKGLLEGAFQWAYAATKTRTVSLDLDEADAAGATLLVRTSAPTTGVAAGSALREEALLPAAMRRRMQEMGVMVGSLGEKKEG